MYCHNQKEKCVDIKVAITSRKSNKDRHAMDKRKRTNGQTMIYEATKEEFEAAKEVIRIRKSKKERQYNGQKKMDKRTNNDLQTLHIKLKIE